MAAICRGKHVYCEKPLAHSVSEVRALQKAAREHRVITQLGNQGHSFDHIRLFCEWIWDGAIGNVHTIHAQRPSDYSRIDSLPLLQERPPVPETLDWDLWLGPAAERPYHPEYLPGKWRGWMPFGTGVLGDWTCHIVDPVFWALDLGSPQTVQAKTDGYAPEKHADTFPHGTMVTYEFAAKGDRGPVTLHWYDGSLAPPKLPGIPWQDFPRNTSAVVLGDRGGIRYGSHGATGVRVFPEEKMLEYERPEPTVPRVAGHHQDWLDAIRNGNQAGSNLDYGGALTEIALLGVIATRLAGTKLQWDGPAMRFTNCDQANELLDAPRRPGWELAVQA
jgi:predicted dehydrogenase